MHRLTLIAVTLGAIALGAPASGQDAAPEGDPLAEHRTPEGVGMPAERVNEAQVVDRRGAAVPLDVVFTDETGKRRPLGELMRPDRPLLLQLGYLRCPSLCPKTSRGLIDLLAALPGAPWTPGDAFDVVFVSINPEETANLARQKKEASLEALGNPAAADGWHFLTGTPPAIKSLADAVGFGYRFDTETREFAHGAALFVVSPDGTLTQTIYGATYEPEIVRLSLVEAADGKVGSVLDRVLLYCYHYDPTVGQYTVQVMNVVRVICIGLALAVGVLIAVGLRRKPRPSTPSPVEASSETSPGGVS